jgi:hypothetical protein
VNVDGVCIAGGTMCGGGAGHLHRHRLVLEQRHGLRRDGPACCGNGFNEYCSKPGFTCVDPPNAPAMCQPCGGPASAAAIRTTRARPARAARSSAPALCPM